MYTFEDLMAAGRGEADRGEFCRKAVDAFKGSKEYKESKDGEAYYHQHNLTIEKYQKTVYTITGRPINDPYSSNYRLKTSFFRRLVTQQVQYVLGNGMTLEDMDNKGKLGKDFDFQLQKAAKRAMASGRAFGYWNQDHLEVFGFADTPADPGFCPLYSEADASLKAGIRFWFRQVGDDTVCRYTLYEPDGVTEYRKAGDKAKVEVLVPKRAYKIVTKTTKLGGVEDICSENYSAGLPIVQLFANDSHESELNGLREAIDCYDLVKSGLANNVDDASEIFWILKNSGGMDVQDMAQFIQRIKTIHVASVDDDGVAPEAHEQAVPVEARKTLLEILRKDIYEDFQALDVNTLSAAAKTTQEIQAAYQSQDNKCADFEYYIIDFVQRILELAGIEDNPSFVWNRVVNQAEQANMIMQAAQFLTDDMIIKKLPFLTPEEAAAVIDGRAAESLDRFRAQEEEREEEDDQSDDGNEE